jgi:teichuronic acid biosynthesis glycosyltransferase TuaC
MKTLFISNVFPNPVQRVKGLFNYEMLRALSRHGPVKVIAPISWFDRLKALPRGGWPAKSLVQEGLEIHHPTFYYPPKALRTQYGWFYWRSIRRTVRSVLASFRPDAVLGYWAHPDGEAAVRAGRLAGVPAGVMVGGSDVLLLTRDSRRRRRIVQVLQAADLVITVSDEIREKLHDFGIDRSKVHIVPRGVDAGHFSPGCRREARQRLDIPAEGEMLLWVGRLVPVKGLDVLLEAFRTLARRSPCLRLYLIGEGPLRKALARTVAAWNLTDRVTFVGPIPQAQLADWYRAADLFVLPSRSEGVPNVLRECVACGTPFVASRVGGIPEAFAHWSEALVPPGEPGLLAEKIQQKLGCPDMDLATEERPLSWAASAAAVARLLQAARNPEAMAAVP